MANVIRTTPELSTLFSLLRDTGLDMELMKADASYTVFAPSNEVKLAPSSNKTKTFSLF